MTTVAITTRTMAIVWALPTIVSVVEHAIAFSLSPSLDNWSKEKKVRQKQTIVDIGIYISIF